MGKGGRRENVLCQGSPREAGMVSRVLQLRLLALRLSTLRPFILQQRHLICSLERLSLTFRSHLTH